jgi:cytochrome c-type biogenesis protein CcmH
MTGFYVGAALLTLCALLFILPTLLRGGQTRRGPAARAVINLAVLRDQLRELDADLAAGTIDAAGYATSRSELERRVASDVPTGPVAATAALGAPRRLAAGALTLAVPLLAGALYVWLGTPEALDPTRMIASQEQARQTELAELVEGMAAQMQKQPNDVAGWTMLARSYASMGNFEAAANSYRHLISLDNSNPDLLVDFADVLAMSRGKTMQGEPEQLVEQALSIDPENIKALSLSGSTLFERGDYAGAIAQWKKILPLVPPDSETARNTIDSIGIAQERTAALKTP